VLYPSATLAKTSNSVIVTINYRLGVYGNLVTTNLVAEDARANWGLQGLTMWSLSYITD